MRAVIQRVSEASVAVDGKVVGSIAEPGLLVLLGVTHDDGAAEIDWMARKVWDLRLLRDERSASDVGAPVLVVSQFTLYGDVRKGRRPSFDGAMPPEEAEKAYDAFVRDARASGIRVETGRLRAMMKVSSLNDGPITIWIDSAR